MTLVTKEKAVQELYEADLKIKKFLISVLNSGDHVPLNSSDVPNNSIAVHREIDNFKNSNLEEKFKLIRTYHNLYQNKNLNSEQKDLLAQANMSVLISRFVFMGIPTELVKEEKEKKQEFFNPNIKKDNYEEAIKYIGKLRSMPNIEKCEYQGKPFQNYLSTIQFRSNPICTQKELEIIKRAYKNLERYNYAMDIIFQLEKKAFPPEYHQEFAYKIAQTLKTSKGICSENQLNCLIEARDKLIMPEIDQMDIYSLMKKNREKVKDKKSLGTEFAHGYL
jgi:hypothetical protein